MENDEGKLLRLEQQIESLLEMQAKRRRTMQRWSRGVAGLLALCAVGFAAQGLAASGSCPSALPFCFQEAQPARASEVNTNFATLVEWIEQKVGPVGQANVQASSVVAQEVRGDVLRATNTQTGTLQATGAVNAANVQATGGVVAASVQAASVVAGNVQASGGVTANQFVANDYMQANRMFASSISTTRIDVTSLLRLPMRATPPAPCNADTLGFIYFDTQRYPGAPSNDWQLPCVCLNYGGYGPRWRQFDNVDAECQ